MLLRTRKSRFIILGVVLSALCFLFVLSIYSPDAWKLVPLRPKFWNPSNDGHMINSTSASLPELSSLPTKSWCDGDGCWRGNWTRRQSLYTTIDELKPWTGCSTKDNGKRLMDIMNWVWVPMTGELREWEPENLIVMLLKSPGGLVVAGDAMSKQYVHTLTSSLQRSNISLELHPQSSFQYVHQYLLKQNDSVTQILFERAGVPISRLGRPVITLIEDDVLLRNTDLRTIVGRVGIKKGFIWDNPFIQTDNWPNLLKHLAAPRTSEGASVKEDTILVLNTGIHWSRHKFTMLKPRSNPSDEQVYLTEVYRQMVRVFTARLKPIPRLSIYYRATTPGHPNCAARPFPYHNLETARATEGNSAFRLAQSASSEAERQEKKRWDWDLFSVHNDVWKRMTARLERERTIELVKNPKARVGAKWRYMDVWDQALLRPDAHADGCLNWCSPAIFGQWTQHIYHSLLSETDRTAD